MTLIGEIGERQLIEDFMSFIRRDGDPGPGDDAAMVGGTVVSSDIVTLDRHFPVGMSYEQFGWYAAAVSFSDIAAMGARPTGILSSLALPRNLDSQAAYDIMSGISQCAEYCGTGIVGGDTKFGPGVVCTTALGTMDGRRPMLRSGARPGDAIAVTGPLGGPAAGFHSIDLGVDSDARNSLYVPIPRVSEGGALAASGVVTSCIDLSDGLGTALNILCKESGTGAEVESSFLPMDPSVPEIAKLAGKDPLDLALYWGGEYELLFTVSPEDIPVLYETEVEFSVIGIMNDTDAPHILHDGKREVMHYGEYRSCRGLLLSQGGRRLQMRTLSAALPHPSGQLWQMRFTQGGRRHSRRIFLREGVVAVCRSDGEEATVPLPSGWTLFLCRRYRMQHAVQTLPELCDLDAVLR